MKDIEELLKQSGSAKPRRGLRANFTSDITNYLAEHPRPKRFARLQEIPIMKWFTKPAIAVSALVFLVIAGGATYAAVGGWPNIVSLFGGQQVLSNGDRIVKVDTKNCDYLSAFTVTGKNVAGTQYYRVKAGSKLTNEQVVEFVLGNCFIQEQSKMIQSEIQKELDKNPSNKGRTVGGYIDNTVTAITDSSITLEAVGWNGGDINQKTTLKFNHIDPNVLVYEGPNRLSWKDIKVGDHVAYSYRASGDALTHSETMGLDQIKPDEQVIVTIFKNTPELSASMDYQKYNRTEFEEVVPCSTHADGYCNYEQKLGQ
jgi:hypothetical protein